MSNDLTMSYTNELLLPPACLGLRVLVVDDDELMREVVAALLRRMGLQHIRFAADGNAALAYVAAVAHGPASVQLVICDLGMDGMDGIECFRNLAAERYAGGLIVLSGSDARVLSTVRRLVQGHGLNLLEVLRKPVDAAALRAAILPLAVEPTGTHASLGQRRAAAPLSVEEIRAGLAAGAVEVYFQPKLATRDGALVSAECLLRWRDPVRGLLSPLLVIPVAEEHGLIGMLTRQVFARAMQTMALWMGRGLRVPLSVNVSMDDLTDLGLPTALRATALAAGVDVAMVTLEVTESRLLQDPSVSLEVISRLCLQGLRVSIDDFGSGHATLESLRRLPFSELKLDRHMVAEAAIDATARAILRSSVALAHELEMTVVAEGIETRAEWDIAVCAGCDELQGFAIARPMPAAAFLDWYLAWQAGPGRDGPPQFPAPLAARCSA